MRFIVSCYRPSSVVCRSVCHTSEPCKNGWSDRGVVCVKDSGGPKKPSSSSSSFISHTEQQYTVSQKTKQICFCQNFVKFPPISTQIRWGGKWVHLAYIWIVSHLSAKNYQNRWKFDVVLTKTNLLSFLGHGVYTFRQVQKGKKIRTNIWP